MADAIYTVVLDLTDDGCIETGWRLKQGDSGLSKIVAKVVNNGVDAFDPSATPEIAFKRADGNSVLSTMVANNGYYEYTFVGNEISVAGRVVMDVTFTDSESRISTCSARFEVVENPAGYDPEGAHTYDNPVSVLVEEAKQDASDAEAWSSGTRNGEPVSSGDPTYHNNSKYWSEQANPTLLQNLQDVVLNSPTEGQALIYDATNEVWKNGNGGGSGSSTLSGLTDVNIESPISGEALIYDFLNQEWINGQAGVTNLNGLTDVVITTPSNNQVLKYDSVSSKWINATGGGGGGLLPHLYIDSEAGSTVTVVAPDSSVITPTQISSGHWECDVPTYGTYIVHAVLNGEDATKTVAVNEVREYHITDTHFSYTLNVYAPQDSMIRIEATGETYTDMGEGSTAVVFSLGQKETQYTITVTYDGLTRTDSVTTPSTSGQSGSKTIEFGTINLTVDEDLIGETIVMAKGTDTVSKVASSTSMVFYPNATGNWRISVDYEGETVYAEPDPIVVSSLSTPVSAELSLVKIPEGATVLPTDDIQTWLACANITNKSYTTLAEVLADRETFETLISDSNACDYMARSTTWVGNPSGEVPKMTSNTTPSGECSGNMPSVVDNAYWRAFDGDDTTSAIGDGSISTTISNAVQYRFESPVYISKIATLIDTYAGGTGSAYKPASNFKQKFYGSNDGETWELIYEDSTSQNLSTIRVVDCINPNKKFSYVKVDLLLDNLCWGIRAKTIQFYGGVVNDADAMSLIGKYDYCSNALLSNATWAEAIANSDYTFIEPLVPTMTGTTTPSGEIVENNPNDSTQYRALSAFDNSSSSFYSPKNDSQLNEYIGYIFDNDVTISKLSMDVANGVASTTYPFTVQTYDGTNWNDADEWSVSSSTTRTTFNHTGSYKNIKGIRIISKTVTLSQAGVQYIMMYALQFYGRASSNVSNTNGIIHTANGDTVTCNGNTYVADTNGIIEIDFSDFDEGTYTFTSGIAKDPTNLSNYYSKLFKITKSPYGGTTELYLMPDAVKTLYWWGYEGTDLEDCSAANGWSLTGRTLMNPTHNTNCINLDSTSTANRACGVGSKSKITGSVNCIGEGISSVYSVYWYYRHGGTKVLDNMTQEINVSTSTLQKQTGSSNNEYIAVNTLSTGGNSNIYAIWYE